jgi:hypothetical protein
MKVSFRNIAMIAAACSMVSAMAPAQDVNQEAATFASSDTNAYVILPQTKLEAFDTNVGTVVIKGSAKVGSVSGNDETIGVRSREMTDATTGRKEQGIAIEIARPGQVSDVALIDYDELDPLLNAIDYLGKLDWSVTSLNVFEAVYTTKGGFRIGAFGPKRTGVIQFAVRSTRTGQQPVVLSRDDVGRLRALIDQAKRQLESLRPAGNAR